MAYNKAHDDSLDDQAKKNAEKYWEKLLRLNNSDEKYV